MTAWHFKHDFSKPMGNIISRQQPTLREVLLSLEEKIHKTELYLEAAKFRRSYISFWTNAAMLLAVPITALMVVFAGMSFVFYNLLFLAIVFFTKRFAGFFYAQKIRSNEKLLTAYKETQRLRVEELKKDVFYSETKKIIEKYDTSAVSETRTRDETKKRSLVDKVTDIVLGSDPSTMYALICANCFSHNGLAHPLEYKLAKFKCYNCNYLNDKTGPTEEEHKRAPGMENINKKTENPSWKAK